MLKNTLFLLLFSLFAYQTTNAQNCPPNDPSDPNAGDFVSGQWTAYVYDLNGTYNNTNFDYSDYQGYYIDAGYGVGNLNFDSTDYWADNSSPSTATNYQGCPVPANFHMVSYKRKGFTTAYYRISIEGKNNNNAHDDSAKLIIDGTNVWKHTGCCDEHSDVWTGQLTPSSEVEFVWMEQEGRSYGAVKVEQIPPPAPDPETFGSGKWHVAVFADRNFSNIYAGFYTEPGLDFNTDTTWGDTNAPSDAPGYSGYPVSTNNHAFIYRRKGFDCGYYQIDIPRYDDAVVLTINGNVVYSDNSWDGNIPTTNVWQGFLDENSTIEFSIQEDGGRSIGALDFISRSSYTNTSYWTGAIDSDMSKPGNWCGALPQFNGGDTFYFPASATNNAILDFNTDVNNIITEAGAEFTIGTNIFLSVEEDIINNGQITTNQGSTIEFDHDSGGLQTISGQGFAAENVIVNNNLDIATSLNGYFSIKDVLTPQAGTITTNDKLYMRCSFVPTQASRTGQIAGGGGTISGDVTTEQCFPAQRAFRLVNASVNTSSSIHANWQEGATAWNDDPNPGYGTHITGTLTDQANGLDLTPSGNPSMFRFDNLTQSWLTVTDTENNNLNVTTPYLLMIRGDRSTDITSNAAAASNTKLRAKGTILQGSQSYTDFTATADAYNLFSNPYHAAVNMNQVMGNSTNVNTNHYTIWDPTISQRGAYVTIDLSNNNTNPSGSDANQYLQPMQSAFFQTVNSGGTPVLNFSENNKNTAAAATETMRSQAFSYLNLRLYTQTALDNDAMPADGLRINFDAAFDNAKTMRDAEKFVNMDENLARTLNGGNLSLEYRTMPQSEEVLPLFTSQYRADNYVFEIEVNGNLGYQAYLKDNYLEESTALNTGLNHISFNLDSDQSASISPNRFSIVFGEENLATDSFESTSLTIYPNPLTDAESLNVQLPQSWTGETNFVIYNMLGQKVFENSFTEVNSALNLSHLQSGVYNLSITNKSIGKTLQKKFIKN